jgi:hypothetical protein
VPAVHAVVGFLVLALTLAAGVLGAWRWYRVEPSDTFWRLLRASQAVLVLQIGLGVVLLVLGHKPAHLHLLYGIVPLVVSFAAEQLRVSAAQAVLDARGHESAEAVGRLPEAEQRSVVLAIVRREIGVMTLGALVVFFLVLRAAQVAGAL